jgi:hypothetical protein
MHLGGCPRLGLYGILVVEKCGMRGFFPFDKLRVRMTNETPTAGSFD